MTRHLMSVDFWDTLILRTLDAQKLRLRVCRKIIEEFSLKISPEGLLKLQQDIAEGLSTIAADLGFDREYKLENSWHFVGSSLMLDDNALVSFVDRAIQIELGITKEFSKLNRKLYKILTNLENNYEISVISDFEGSSEFLREILFHHGIGSSFKIFCSSDYLYRKSSGNLYRIYLEQIEIVGMRKKVHLGDNRYSDFRRPKEFGIDSYLYPRIKIKLEFIRRAIGKIITLRVRKLSYKSDVRVTKKILGNFTREISIKAQTSTRIFYIGSEGAFLSQITWEMLPNEQICLNFGRKQILQALAGVEPKYVLSRLLAEKCTRAQISSFFELKRKKMSDGFFMQAVFSPMEIDFGYLQTSVEKKASVAKEIVTNLNLTDGDLFIDIGYKGTFVRALTLLTGLNFNYLQLFGYRENCADFPNSWSSVYLSDKRKILSYFRINSKMIEILFSDGPRGSKRNNLISGFIQSLEDMKPGYVSAVKLNRYFSSPSTKLDIALKSITHLDDLKTQPLGNQEIES